MTRSPWAREYVRKPNEYIWGLAPSQFAREVRALLPPGARVLELGCGEGRDSVYFASCGCDVTGVDVSAAGLHKAERLARAHGVKVRWLRGDAAHDVPAGPFDLVYSCGAIHYIPRRPRARLFPRLKALTRPGGCHAHVVFTDRAVYVEKGERTDRLLYQGRADPRLRRLAASPVRADADRLCPGRHPASSQRGAVHRQGGRLVPALIPSGRLAGPRGRAVWHNDLV